MYRLLKRENQNTELIEIDQCNERWLAMSQARFMFRQLANCEPDEPNWTSIGYKLTVGNTEIIVADIYQYERLKTKQLNHQNNRKSDKHQEI